jgi:outer membrane protein TolC
MNRQLLFFLFTSLIFHFSLNAQQKLSAKQAVLVALENNYQIQIQEKQQEIAEKNNKWSEAGLFPTVDLTAAIGNSIVDNTNNPLTFTPGLIANRSTSPGLTVNWNLFTGLAVKMNKQRLEQLEQQTEGNGFLIIENTAHDVLKAYFNALLQKKRLQVLKELYLLSKEQAAYEEKKSAFGQSNKLSVLQLNNQLYSDSLNVMQQRIVYENTLRNLMLLMNVSSEELENDVFPELTDSLSFNILPVEKESVLSDMKNNNQNIKNQLINLELQRTSTQIQRSFLYPTLSIQFGATPNFGNFRLLGDDLPPQQPGFPNVGEGLSTQQITYFANVNLRYSLFNNWKDKRSVEVAKIQEEIAQLNYEESTKQLTSTALNFIQQFNMRSQLVNIAAKNAEYAELAFQVGKERFALGSINSLELSQLRNAFLNAKLDELDNQYQKIDVYLEIYKLTGKFQLDYVKE